MPIALRLKDGLLVPASLRTLGCVLGMGVALGIFASSAQGHKISAARAHDILYLKHGPAVAEQLPSFVPGSRAALTATKQDCRPRGSSRRHRHVLVCKLQLDVSDGRDTFYVKGSRRLCTDTNVRIEMKRTSRRLRVIDKRRYICRLVRPRKAVPAPIAPQMTAPAPAPPPASATREIPPTTAASAPRAPVGEYPGPPPPFAFASTGSLTSLSPPMTRMAQAGTDGSWCCWSGWYVIENMYVNTAWWREGSTAPAGAHIIGWQDYWYYQQYFWGYDASGRVGYQFWRYGRISP